jgi:WD40 repeat protein
VKSLLTLAAAFATTLSGVCAAQELRRTETLTSPIAIVSAIICGADAHVLGIGKDGALYEWTPAGAARRLGASEGKVAKIACSPDGQTIAAGLTSGVVLLMTRRGDTTHRLQITQHDFGTMHFSPDASLLAVTANDSPTQLWDARTGTLLATGKTTLGASAAAAFSPDGQRYLSADEDTTIRAYNARGELLFAVEADLLEPFAVDYTPDGTKFAVAGAGGTVSLFDAANGRKLKTSTNLGNPIMFMMMSPGGREVAAVDFDDFKFVPIGLRLWDLNSNEWKTVSLDLKNIIGAGTDKRNLVLIKSEGPEAISLWGVQ